MSIPAVKKLRQELTKKKNSDTIQIDVLIEIANEGGHNNAQTF